MTERTRRHSKAFEAELLSDPQAKAEAEARNGLRQFDYGIQTVHQALERGSFKLRPSLILALQREALQVLAHMPVIFGQPASRLSAASTSLLTLISFLN